MYKIKNTFSCINKLSIQSSQSLIMFSMMSTQQIFKLIVNHKITRNNIQRELEDKVIQRISNV